MLTSFHSSIIQKIFMASIILFLSGIGISPLYAAEPNLERVWDQDLKRWLTPEELGHMEVYFTEDEAAKVMFPDSGNIRRETLTLTAEQKEFVEQRIGWKFPETSFPVFLGETNGTFRAYRYPPELFPELS